MSFEINIQKLLNLYDFFEYQSHHKCFLRLFTKLMSLIFDGKMSEQFTRQIKSASKINLKNYYFAKFYTQIKEN